MERSSAIRVIITGGTFDKHYDEMQGSLTFKDSHLPEILTFVRCTVPIELELNQLIDSLDMHDGEPAAGARVLPPGARGAASSSRTAPTPWSRPRGCSAGRRSPKTIVLTGAMVPYIFSNSDAVFNFGCAVTAVQLCAAGGVDRHERAGVPLGRGAQEPRPRGLRAEGGGAMNRPERADQLHRQGANCAQSVACAFAEDLGADTGADAADGHRLRRRHGPHRRHLRRAHRRLHGPRPRLRHEGDRRPGGEENGPTPSWPRRRGASASEPGRSPAGPAGARPRHSRATAGREGPEPVQDAVRGLHHDRGRDRRELLREQ